jgi:hypothetical protein
MALHTIQAPNGKTYEVNAPEGASESEILEYAKTNIDLTTAPVVVTDKKPTEQEVAQFTAENPEASSEQGIMGKMFGMGSPTASLVKGAVLDPLVGINQYLGATGIFGEEVKQKSSQLAIEFEKANKDALAKAGRGETDVVSLMGAIVSPFNKIMGAAKAANVFMKIGEEAVKGAVLAGMQPTTGGADRFWEDKNVQMGLGAALSGAGTGLFSASKTLVSFLKTLPLNVDAKQKALVEYVHSLVGKDKTEVVTALREAGELVKNSKPTASEALGDIPAGVGLANEQKRLVSQLDSNPNFNARNTEQANARTASLESEFGSAADIQAAKVTRGLETAPMREAALKDANFYAETASKFETQLQKGTSTTGSVIPKDSSGVLKAQIENIKSLGYYPLVTKGLVDNIDKTLNSPGNRSNEMLTFTLAKLKTKLSNLSDNKGIINSADLYNIRKEVNGDIAEYMQTKGGANASFKAQAVNVEKALKGNIDKEINKAAGNALWTSYLSKFADHSRKIDQMSFGRTLIDKLGGTLGDVEKAGVFATTMANPSAAVKASTGLPRYSNPEDFLTASQSGALKSVLADLNRKTKAFELGKGVEKPVGVEIAAAKKDISVLSRVATIGKGFLQMLERGSQKEFDAKLTQLLLNPKDLADVLESIPPSKMKVITEIINKKASSENKDLFINMYTLPEQVIRGSSAEVGKNI